MYYYVNNDFRNNDIKFKIRVGIHIQIPQQ